MSVHPQVAPALVLSPSCQVPAVGGGDAGHGYQGVWVGSAHNCHSIRDVVFPSLLRDFPGISAPVCPLSKETPGKPPCRYLLWQRGGKILPQPVPGEGGVGFAFIPKNHYISAEFFVSPSRVFTAKAVFTSQLSTSGIRFQFIKKKKKFKIHGLDETPSPLYLPTVFSFNFVSVANARRPK